MWSAPMGHCEGQRPEAIGSLADSVPRTPPRPSHPRPDLTPTLYPEHRMARPELLCALGGFLLGVAITRIAARFRMSRLHARLEAAEFEAAQLRDDLLAAHPGPREFPGASGR